MTKEEKFFKALRDIFIGAKVEGTGGFINLMRMKSKYYEKVEKLLKEDVDKETSKYPSFREELFDKLYTFFKRYFTESGSIYFNSTPFHNNVYEKIYTDEKDVVLFWKTRMLYYVKTDKIFKSLPVEFDGKKFYFDASQIELKKANEKKELIYEFKKVSEDGTIHLMVTYSEKGRKTKVEEILKEVKKAKLNITEEDLMRAIRVFEKQSEVDYFINKNAREFLKEQFDLWLYQYITNPDIEWTLERIEQIQILKRIAYKLIDFVAQFEEELVKIWNKPKFVRNSNYVISLDKIVNKNGGHILEKLQKHEGWKDQVKEWIELGMITEEPKTLIEQKILGKELNDKYKFLPVDTKYFKSLEVEILELFDNLEEELDGWVIKSENYQALNTILPKFRKKVKAIYIDPPYNTGSDEFIYKDRFRYSAWLSMIENRITLSREFLSEDGLIFISIGDTMRKDERVNSTSLLQILLNSIFGLDNYVITFVRKSGISPRQDIKFIANAHDYVLCYAKNIDCLKVTKRSIDTSNYKYKDQHFEKRGFFSLNKLDRGSIKFSEKLCYKISIKKGQLIEIFDGKNFVKTEAPENIEILPGDGKKGWIFRWSKEKVLWGIENDYIVFRKINNKWKVYYKEYTKVDNEGKEKSHEAPYDSLILDIFNEKGTKRINDLFGTIVFNYTKPVELIEFLFKLISDNRSIYMDFFAGSGTTGEAIIRLNIQDGGKRKFILVEASESFYDVLLPRLKKISYSLDWKDGRPQKSQGYEIFFVYYELEQYEDTLAKSKYDDKFFETDVFSGDLKLLSYIDVDYDEGTIYMNLEKLDPKLDLFQTLSNAMGKSIKRITSSGVEFEDIGLVNQNNIDKYFKFYRNYLYW